LPTGSHDHSNGAQRQQFVTTITARAAVKLGWLRRRSVASASQYKPTGCRARAGVSTRAPHTSPVISRKIHGDMALSRTLLARAGVLLCEPPKSVGKGWAGRQLGWGAGRNPSSASKKYHRLYILLPSIIAPFGSLDRTQRHLCLLPRVAAVPPAASVCFSIHAIGQLGTALQTAPKHRLWRSSIIMMMA
jgi:hypothetical protein